MTNHIETTLALVGQVEECQDHLADLYEIPAPERDARMVARLHDESRTALKLAGVHANLAVAQQIKALRDDLSSRGGRLIAGPLTQV